MLRTCTCIVKFYFYLHFFILQTTGSSTCKGLWWMYMYVWASVLIECWILLMIWSVILRSELSLSRPMRFFKFPIDTPTYTPYISFIFFMQSDMLLRRFKICFNDTFFISVFTFQGRESYQALSTVFQRLFAGARARVRIEKHGSVRV